MELSQIFGCKETVLRLLDKQTEVRKREENVKLYRDTYDPSQPGALVNYQKLHMSIDRTVLEELGYGSCISDWETFTGIDDLVIPYFKTDKEIMTRLGYPHMGGSMYGDLLNSPFTDVGLVSIETKEAVQLSDLYIHEERPLLIIASSLS